jgi:hypothetical protein
MIKKNLPRAQTTVVSFGPALGPKWLVCGQRWSLFLWKWAVGVGVVVVVVMREVSRESVEENNKLELCIPSGSYSPSKW